MLKGGKLTTDRISGAALIIFSLLVILQSSALPLGTFRQPGPAYIPILLALLLLILGALLAARWRCFRMPAGLA